MSLDRVSERLIAELRALLPDVPEWHSKSNPAAREWMITGSVGEGENEVRWSCTVAPEDDERPSKALICRVAEPAGNRPLLPWPLNQPCAPS